MVSRFVNVIVLSVLFCSPLDAQQVQFDVSRTVACEELSLGSIEGRVQQGQKLVQARVSVSVLAQRGEAEDITECLYRFESSASSTQIVDFLPRTTMDSSVAGNIQVQRSNEASDQVNLSVNAGLDSIRASGGGSKSDSSRAAYEYELIPPQEMVAAVGTTGRGTGVYFKLRRTPQISLEGFRDFVITLQIPSDWRGGYFRATCQAVRRTSRGATILGSGTFVVPLYTKDDLIARRLAENFSESEQRLYASARKHQRDVQRRSLPTIAHELSLVDPKIPASWLGQVIAHHSITGTRLAFERRLPVELQAVIDDYREARLRLTQLRGEIDSGLTATAVLRPSSSFEPPASVSAEPASVSAETDADVYVRANAWRARSG